jgi:hypothetical protein
MRLEAGAIQDAKAGAFAYFRGRETREKRRKIKGGLGAR